MGQTHPRTLGVTPPFDLARTTAPVWWARGRWPNVDWRDRTLHWVGWEDEGVVWRSVRQVSDLSLTIAGSGVAELDGPWAEKMLGASQSMPGYGEEVLLTLSAAHRGMKPWAAGSLFEGVVSSLIGQSISVASAAVTERRLYAMFNAPMEIAGRPFWPPPQAEQLAAANIDEVRTSGVTRKRAEALIEVGQRFAAGELVEPDAPGYEQRSFKTLLQAISGVGPWTVRSAFLWGVGDPDAHPTGDVALLRAVRRHLPEIETLKDLDVAAARWAPYRGWAARLFWLDLLGFDDGEGSAP